MPRRSAGLLLYRRAPSLEVLLVHPGGPFWARKDEGAWSIPKGEVEDGEEPLACALRELAEELGDAAPVPEAFVALGAVRQRAGKEVLAWAASADFDPARLSGSTIELEWPPRSGRRRQVPEVDRAEWFAPDEARKRINPAQAALVDRLEAVLAAAPEPGQ